MFELVSEQMEIFSPWLVSICPRTEDGNWLASKCGTRHLFSDKLKEREKKENENCLFFIEDFTIQGKIGIRCWFAGIIDSQLRGDSVCLMQMTNH